MSSTAKNLSDLLRVYEPSECGKDGYPLAWHRCPDCNPGDSGCAACEDGKSIKGLVRALAGGRCIRCGHPYIVDGGHYPGGGEWSPCDELCTHAGPVRVVDRRGTAGLFPEGASALQAARGTAETLDDGLVEARWRILTVHHLTGEKRDCRWWNLVALCQRDHLAIQGKVNMAQVWPYEHSDWMKPYAAGYYAATYLGEELSRAETMERLDELLALERAAA